MLKTIIVLPDGTELSSGVGAQVAIQSITVTECVNSAQELTLGSTCANMVEAKLLAPEGALSITAGDELAVYREEGGVRHPVGLFTTEKPTRPTANTLSVTAYDRVSWLDRDLSLWLASLDAWPYSLFDLAGMVCAECGLELANEELPNGDYMVSRFSADGVTGRQILSWVGQAAGRFCRATPEGKIEFAWYTPLTTCAIGPQKESGGWSYADGDLSLTVDGATVTDDGAGNVALTSEHLTVTDDGSGNVILVLAQQSETLVYYQNGLSFEDYTVADIQKVQLRQNEEDVGTVYPDIAETVNTYVITGNCLLTAADAQELLPIAQTLYAQLKDVSYTPCKVTVPAQLDIHAGHTVQITDRNGRTLTAYIMTKTQSGQRDTLECTGAPNRGSSTAVNNQSYAALSGKVLNLRTDVDGLKAENADMQGNFSKLEMDLAGVTTAVQLQQQAADGVKTDVTKLQQTATELSATVQSIRDNGVDKVTTTFGLTVDGSALTVHRSGSDMTNRINEQGMYVLRNGGTPLETVMLRADAQGVLATDVSVRNYLNIGSFARLEDYSDGTDRKRTACYWREDTYGS